MPPAFATARVVRNSSTAATSSTLHVLTWNIDRGTRYNQVLNTLKCLRPDIVLLQEVDAGTMRSGRRDVAKDLADSLGLTETYGIEFEELGQEKESPAYTGQATFSRLPVRSARVLRFQNQSGWWKPRSWIPASVPVLQRRIGNRIALATELELEGKLLVVYNLHLESRSYGRIQFGQLNEVLADFSSHYPPSTAVLIGGDLNSKYLPSRYLRRMEKDGFHSAVGEQIERTHVIAMALDWLFARGLPEWQNGRVEKSVQGSDHYAVAASLTPKR